MAHTGEPLTRSTASNSKPEGHSVRPARNVFRPPSYTEDSDEAETEGPGLFFEPVARSAASNPERRSLRPARNVFRPPSYTEDSGEAETEGPGLFFEPGAEEALIAEHLRSARIRRPVRSSPSPGYRVSRRQRDTPRIERSRLSPRSVAAAQSQRARLAVWTGTRGSNSVQKPAARYMQPWPPGLPYGILFKIFQYAAYPLVNDFLVPHHSVRWLVEAARICKDFAEPALSALYLSPPLHPPSRCRGLMKLLRSKGPLYIDYAAKVKYLELHVVSVLTLKDAGRDPINLAELVALTPLVRGIEFFLAANLPPLARRVEHKRVAKVLNMPLFDQMDRSGIRLREWQWNCYISKGSKEPWLELCEIHSRPAFAKLQALVITHLDALADLSQKMRQSCMTEMCAAIGMLDNLRSLTLANGCLELELLTKLSPLQHLSIINCSKLDSAKLGEFLESHGAKLTELVLDHNRALNLDFMADLSSFCPALTMLKVDMTFFSQTVTGQDHDAGFDELLSEGTIPKWPSTLRSIELLYMRRWGPDAAERFFKSLHDSAEELPDLRKIVMRASVDMPWRDRAKFREFWQAHFKSAFLRQSAPPVQHFAKGEFLATQIERQNRLFGIANGFSTPKAHATNTNYTRNNDNDNNSNNKHTTGTTSDWFSTHSTGPLPVKSKRQQTRQRTAEEEFHNRDKQKGEQRMCDEVDVLIENLRPMERIYNEDDFLDPETEETGR